MSITYRMADRDDIPVLAQLRKRQLIDEGQSPDMEIDGELRQYFERHFADRSLVEWVAEDGDRIVATAAIVFMDFPPAFNNRTGIRGYVTNMYTAPSHRRRGIAAALLEKLVDEAGARGVRTVLLAASQMGKPVYRRFGFAEADGWMELV